ncbi:MAG: hypothetical protein ACREL5_13665 [Gemmatimonadales bacterium]
MSVALPQAGNQAVWIDLPRGLPALPDTASALLVRFSDARVLSSRTPLADPNWSSRSGHPRFGGSFLTAAGSCAFSGPGVWCGDTVGITPYVGITGGFQSDAGSGPSSAISITFSQAVRSFAVTVNDPDWPGNAVVALGAGGSTLDSVAVAGDSMPGFPTSVPVEISTPGIDSVHLIVAPLDYIYYTDASFGRDTFVVSCSAATRGESTTCTATSASGTGTLAISKWRFKGPAPDTITIEATTSDTFWTGTVALGGTVCAIGAVSGLADTGSTSLVANPRSSWSTDTLRYQLDTLGQGTLSDPPNHLWELGVTQPAYIVDTSASSVAVISDGPNSGLYYFTRNPVEGFDSVSINYAALSPGGVFYGWQTGPWPTCIGDSAVAFIPRTKHHEGTALDKFSHTWYFRSYMNALVAPLAEAEVDRQSRWDLGMVAYSDELYARIDSVLDFSGDSGRTSHGLVKPAPIGCQFIY